jgi:hypothetical protein
MLIGFNRLEYDAKYMLLMWFILSYGFISYQTNVQTLLRYLVHKYMCVPNIYKIQLSRSYTNLLLVGSLNEY